MLLRKRLVDAFDHLVEIAQLLLHFLFNRCSFFLTCHFDAFKALIELRPFCLILVLGRFDVLFHLILVVGNLHDLIDQKFVVTDQIIKRLKVRHQ